MACSGERGRTDSSFSWLWLRGFLPGAGWEMLSLGGRWHQHGAAVRQLHNKSLVGSGWGVTGSPLWQGGLQLGLSGSSAETRNTKARESNRRLRNNGCRNFGFSLYLARRNRLFRINLLKKKSVDLANNTAGTCLSRQRLIGLLKNRVSSFSFGFVSTSN